MHSNFQSVSKTLSALLALTFLGPQALAQEKLTKEQLDKLRSLYQDSRSASMAKDYAKANECLQQVLQLLPVPKDSPVFPDLARVRYDMACNYAQLGKEKEALDELGRAVASGFWDHNFLSRDETLKGLRAKSEFAAIVEKARRGMPEMAFGLKDVMGREIKKQDYAGKVLVIDVWGTWCPPCRMEIPHFVRLQERYGKEGLAVIGLNWERGPPDESVRRKVERFAGDNKINYQVALVPQGLLNCVVPPVMSFPTTFYVNRDGVIVDRVAGAEGYDEIEKRILPLIKAKATTPPAEAGAGK